jgi:hypothetical protein
MSLDDATRRPTLRLVRGDATEEEIAALLAVIAAGTSAEPEAEPAVTSAWTDRAPLLRGGSAHSPGPGAWRASAWPR